MDEWTFTVIWRICVCLIALALYTYVAYQFGKSKAEIFDNTDDEIETEEALHDAYQRGRQDALMMIYAHFGYKPGIQEYIENELERNTNNEEN